MIITTSSRYLCDLLSFPTRRSSDLPAVAALPAAAEEAPAAGEAGIEPEFVRPLVPIARGRNDSNPVWSPAGDLVIAPDRKSTRLNSSHVENSYAVFCLKKKIEHAET